MNASSESSQNSIADGLAKLSAAVDIRDLHKACREGRLYDVEQWIHERKPIQTTPAGNSHNRGRTALQIAVETGQHSLVLLFLKSGYRLDLEHCSPLDLALQIRRWDLADLLLEWGAKRESADVYTVLNTYNADLYERFWAAGYDLTARDEMGAILGSGTTNRPLLGFVRRHRAESQKIQHELNIALGCHVRAGNDRGVNLCLWAGANPHQPAPNLQLGHDQDNGEDGGEGFKGWTAIEEASSNGHLGILKRLGPDPAIDDFDNLYKYAKDSSIISFLRTLQAPKDIGSILYWHLMWLASPTPWGSRAGTWTIEALLGLNLQWHETDADKLAQIRRLLLKTTDYDFKTLMSRLKRPEMCTPLTYAELIRTPTMQTRLLSLGLLKKPISEKQKRKEELDRLMRRYDRTLLYQQIWSSPMREVAKVYGISDVRLGKVCRVLQIPSPPRGYWARVQNGYAATHAPLKPLA